MPMRRSRGTWVPALSTVLGVIALLAIAGIGYYVWRLHSSTPTHVLRTQSVTHVSKPPVPSAKAAASGDVRALKDCREEQAALRAQARKEEQDKMRAKLSWLKRHHRLSEKEVALITAYIVAHPDGDTFAALSTEPVTATWTVKLPDGGTWTFS